MVVSYLKSLRAQSLRNYRSPFLKAIYAVASGTAVAQAVQLVVAPITTRLYDPADLGGASALLALVSMLLPWATLGFSSSLVVMKSALDVRHAYRICKIAALFICLITLVYLIFSFERTAAAVGLSAEPYMLFLLAPILLFSASRESAIFLLLRAKKFNQVSRASISQAILLGTMRIAGGFVFPSIGALVLSYLLTLVIQSRLLLRATRLHVSELPTSSLIERLHGLSELTAFVKEHRDYPLYRAPQAFLSATSQGLPILFVSSFIGIHEAGLVALARTITSAPITLVANAVSMVSLSFFSSALNEGKSVFKMQLRTTLMLAAVGILPSVALFLFGPELFSLVFGSPWRASGEVASLLSLILFFQFISRPSTSAIQPLGLIRWQFKFEILSTILKCAALYIGYLRGGYLSALAFYSIAGAVSYVVIMCVAMTTSVRRGNPPSDLAG